MTRSQPTRRGGSERRGCSSGAKYSVDATWGVEKGSMGGMSQQVIFNATVQAGETKDLGDLVLDPAKAPNR